MQTIYNKLLKAHLNLFLDEFHIEERVNETVADSDICALANHAFVMSNSAVSDRDQLYIMTCCALLWELMKPEWAFLPVHLSQVLMNIGFMPSARMVNMDNNKLVSSGSILDDMWYSHEINKVTVKTSYGSSLTLSRFQLRLWKGVEEYKYIGVSAPTSAGKSFVLANMIVDAVNISNGTAVYIVPTISLINQVYRDIKKIVTDNKLTGITISKSSISSVTPRGNRTIYVLTQERAMSIIQDTPKTFDNLALFIVDEIQNLEKVANEAEERSKILYDIIESINELNPDSVVLSGPRISNINEIISKLYPGKGVSISDEVPPVVNFSYSFKKSKHKDYIKLTQFSPLNDETTILIKDKFGFAKILGKKRYDGQEIYNIISMFTSTKNRSGNIVFAKSTPSATKIATEVAALSKSDYHSDTLNSFIDYIKSNINPKYVLCSALRKRVAFHHGKVPEHIRILLEHYFAEGIIRTIVCTTTLMQGVNFPTRNIIIRNPDLASTDTLTGYEFSNLKGRAGRLHKDFVGRTIILDEEAFQKKDVQLGMFEDKKVDFTYEHKYKELHHQIEDIVTGDIIQGDSHCKDIVTKIRSTAFKYSDQGYLRLKRIGIDIPPNIYKEVVRKITSLAVPREVVLKNPYWDPVDLNVLFNNFKNGITPRLPHNPYHLDDYIKHILNYFSTYHQYYYKKYVDVYDALFTPIAIMAKNWAIGVKLADIIDPPTWQVKSSEDIDNRISFINNTIRHGITKLLKPLVVMEDPNSNIISALEHGTLNGTTKLLIEAGIPREIAIRIPPQVYEAHGLLGVSRYAAKMSEFDKLVIDEVL